MSMERPEGPERDDPGQSAPSRNPQKRRSSGRTQNDVPTSSEPEPTRPRSPDRSNSLPTNPEAIPRSSEREPSTSRRFRQSSYDRSDSYPLLEIPDATPMIPLANIYPPPTNNYFSFGSRPERDSRNEYDSGTRTAQELSREIPSTMYDPGIRSVPLPPRQMPYSTYDSGIGSVPQPPRPYTEIPGVRSTPQPSRQMPYTEIPVMQPTPQPPRQMPYTEIPGRQPPYSAYDSWGRSTPQPFRQGPGNVYDSAPQSVPLPSRQMPNDTYGWGPQSIPLPPSQPAQYVGNPYSGRSYARARRGDAFVANDPFRPSNKGNESENYDSFDNMPTDMAPSVPYGIPSQPISLPPPHSLPARPPAVPSQPIILPQPYPPFRPDSPIIPSQAPIIPPQAPTAPSPVIPTQPIIPGTQPTIIYPSDPYTSPQRYPWYRPSPERPTTPPSHPPVIPYLHTDYPESVQSRPDSPTPSLPPIIIPSPRTPSPPPIIIPSPPMRPRYSPISSPTTPSTPTRPDGRPWATPPGSIGEHRPTIPLSPVRRSEVAEDPLPTSTPTSHESFGDPSMPIPSEYPNGYGPYFQQHGINVKKKKVSFGSTLRKLFSWPFPHLNSKPKPTPYAYDQQPYSYPYPSGYVPQVYYPPPGIVIVTPGFTRMAGEFVTKTLPTHIYSNFLLRLPSLYFSRVARIFEEADLTLPELKRMALETASKDMAPDDFYVFESTLDLPPQYTRLKATWENFIDSVMREWKTFNIISVLLLSAILTVLQIQAAEQDPIIRYTALASLICALISLLFGCMYIIRFGTMRKTYKAAEWALEAKRTRTTVWWNVWVLLAMPVVWLVWSIILYIACVMTFIWRTTSQDVAAPLIMSNTTILVLRVVLSSVLGLGILYAVLIVSTFRRYGEKMDNAWKERIRGWIESKGGTYGPSQPGPSGPYPYSYLQNPVYPYPPVYPMDDPGTNAYLRTGPTYGQPVPIYVPTPPPPPDGTRPRDYYGYGYPPDQKTPYLDSDDRPTYGYGWPPPAVPGEPRNPPSRKDSEPSSMTSSAYRSGQEPPSRQQTDRQSSTGNEPDDKPSSSLPQVPTRIHLPPTDHPRGARAKRRVSVPPPTTLPTIPGTPGTSTLSYISPVYTESPPSMGQSSLKLDNDDPKAETSTSPALERTQPTRQPRRDSSRVQFRSPLVSAQSADDTASRTGSQQEVVDSAKSSTSGVSDLSTNVPWTPFPSPISRDP